MNNRIPWTKSAVAMALVLLSGSSLAIDLMGAYEKALAADPDLLAARQALLAGREKAVQGRALRLPQVSLAAGLSHVQERSSSDAAPPASAPDPVHGSGDGSGRVRQVAVQLLHPLYSERARADEQQLLQQAGLAETSWRQARQGLMQRVSEAYFGVLLAQHSLAVAQAEKAAVGLQRERAQARFDVGRGKITEVQETQARYDGVLAREVSAASTLALQRARLQELTRAGEQPLSDVAEGLVPTPPLPDDLAAWQARGHDQNAAILVKRAELAIAGAEIAKHRLRGRPTLDLVASYTYKDHSGGLSPALAPDGSRVAALGVQLNIPLYAGGALDSRERESMARQREAEQALSAAERDARLQVHDAFVAVKTGAARIAALTQSLRSAGSALEATTLGRDVGSRTELDVLDAQQRVFTARLELAQARHDYLLGRVSLAYAAGELQEADLQALNAQLEPPRR